LSGGPVGSLLLDTCALIWLMNGELDGSEARPMLAGALRSGGLLVSTTSAWEIGLLSRSTARLRFLPDPKTWFARAVAQPGIRLAAITPEVAIDSSHLPGDLHGDPADRLIIATSRHLGAPVVTRDRRMIEYAASGHVAVVCC
jgi:PIN domain nuclease of toxin-antitoxin system